MSTFRDSALWPVEPKQRAGPFVLGMGVNEALAVVQKMGSLDRAELSFDEQHPFDADIALRMPSLGLQLCFDGFQQDLRLITVCLRQLDLDPTPSMLPPLSYGSRVFAGVHQQALCLRDVYAMFGPTYIGDFQSGARAAYFLRYPGITFEFPLPLDMVDALAARAEHPMELPGRPPPTAVRMWVFAEDSPSFATPASALPDLPEAVVVRPAVGVELRGRMLRFGSMPQDVFSDFGPPEQVCVKDVDAVRIHSARAVPSRMSGPDYYYNYFHLGLDVLFDGRTHLVKKVILHTNPPMHELFSRYTRCFFQIPIEMPSGNVADPDGLVNGGARSTAVKAPAPLKPEEDLLGMDGHDLLRQELELLLPPCLSDVPEAAEVSMDAGQETVEQDVPVEREDGMEGGTGGEGAGDEDDPLEPFRAMGRKMSKKERKAAKKIKKSSSRPASGAFAQEASPVLSSELSASPEPSPLLSCLEGMDRDGDIGGGAGGTPPRGEAPGGRVDAIDSEALCFEDLLPPPALPLDGECPDAADGGLSASYQQPGGGTPAEAGDAAGGGTSSPRGPCPAEPPAVSGSTEELCIDVRWPWPEIQELLGSRAGISCGKPLIVSQSGHTPFGSTYFYAFPGLAFEVMQNSGLASLTVFSVPREELPSVFLPCKAPHQAPGTGRQQ